MCVWFVVVIMVLFVVVMGCLLVINVVEFKVGDCVKFVGMFDWLQVIKVECGSLVFNFKVVVVVQEDYVECLVDVDFIYLMCNVFNGLINIICLDIDWVIGGCMSVDFIYNIDLFWVDCDDVLVLYWQWVIQILKDFDFFVSVDQCVSGVGYVYIQ